MNIYTENEALKDLIVYGKTKDKRYSKLPKEAIKGFIKAISYLKAVERIEDLYRFKGLNYEKLIGKRKGQESVRCDRTWRLIFKSSPKDNCIIITEVELIEISKHYE